MLARKVPGFPSAADALAWSIAKEAAGFVVETGDVQALVVGRIIDNAALAAVALGLGTSVFARNRALMHPLVSGSAVFGAPAECRVSPEWAAWANSVAVREACAYHDVFAAGYPYPGDIVHPLVAVAQSHHCRGADLIRGIAVGYDVQAALASRVEADRPPIDHIAALGPAAAAGIAAMLRLSPCAGYGGIRQALHRCDSIRRSRKRKTLGWQNHAQARVGKVAVEALKGTAPDGAEMPCEEARLYPFEFLRETRNGRALVDVHARGPLPEGCGWALIALARRLGPRIGNFDWVENIVFHTKLRIADCDALAYVLAVALQDCGWQHERAYAPDRSSRPDTMALLRKIRIVRHHQPVVGKVVVMLKGGGVLQDELAGAGDAVAKFRALSEGVLSRAEQDRFLATARCLPELEPGSLTGLSFTVA